MNYGKLTELVYKRSVDKVIRDISQKNMSFYDGAALGADCAILPSGLFSARALASGRDENVAAPRQTMHGRHCGRSLPMRMPF